MLPQDGNGLAVDADDPGPAALGHSFCALAADDCGRSAKGDLSRLDVNGIPAQVEQLAATSSRVSGEAVVGVEPMRSRGRQEGVELLGGPDPCGFRGMAPAAVSIVPRD